MVEVDLVRLTFYHSQTKNQEIYDIFGLIYYSYNVTKMASNIQ